MQSLLKQRYGGFRDKVEGDATQARKGLVKTLQSSIQRIGTDVPYYTASDFHYN